MHLQWFPFTTVFQTDALVDHRHHRYVRDESVGLANKINIEAFAFRSIASFSSYHYEFRWFNIFVLAVSFLFSVFFFCICLCVTELALDSFSHREAINPSSANTLLVIDIFRMRRILFFVCARSRLHPKPGHNSNIIVIILFYFIFASELNLNFKLMKYIINKCMQFVLCTSSLLSFCMWLNVSFILICIRLLLLLVMCCCFSFLSSYFLHSFEEF